jgi:hypothetical protein
MSAIPAKRSLAVFVIVLAAAGGCRRGPDTSSLPSELVVLPGAYNIRVNHLAEGGIGLLYDVSIPYPAESAVAAITQALRAPAWSTGEEPAWKSMMGFLSKPPVHSHQWMADWRNQEGRTVSYVLRYESKFQKAGDQSPPDNERLLVTAVLKRTSQSK